VVGNCIGARNKASFLAVIIFVQANIFMGMSNLVLGVVHFAKKAELSLDTNTAFQAVCYTVGALEFLYIVVAFAYCLGFHYGLAEEYPFRLLTRYTRNAFDRRFFSSTVARQSVKGWCVFRHRKCSTVASMLAENSSNGGKAGEEDAELGERKSEERPLTEEAMVEV
jgi:hypothetical protein